VKDKCSFGKTFHSIPGKDFGKANMPDNGYKGKMNRKIYLMTP
jgi:hypothetical protein